MEQHAPQPRRYTAKEYFQLERDAVEKHEYRDGEIIAMAGGTEAHSLITANIIGELRNRLKNHPCRVYDSNLRVQVKSSAHYSYPDAFVVCGDRQFDPLDEDRMTISNPKLVIEVLSPSTEILDRGEKFARYILLDSLEEYVLVSQNKPRVETFHRQGDGTWTFAYFEGRDAVVKLHSLNIELPLTEVYANVELPPEPPEGMSAV